MKSSRVEGTFAVHSREISQLEFLDPYPILVSSSTDGYICVWGVRGCDISLKYGSLCCLVNLQLQEYDQATLIMRSLTSFVGVQKAIPKKYKCDFHTDEDIEKLKEKYLKVLTVSSPDGRSLKKKTISNPGTNVTIFKH